MKTAGCLYTLPVLLRVQHLIAHSRNLSRLHANRTVLRLVADGTELDKTIQGLCC